MVKNREAVRFQQERTGMNYENLYDVTIIGGGAVGLFTAFYSGLRGLKTKLIEANEDLGGKVTIGFPDKLISDIGGITEITGIDLIQQLEQQAKTFDPTIICGEWISDLEKLQDGRFRLTSSTGEIHDTKTVILTVGNGKIAPMKLDVQDAEHYEARSLFYWVDDSNRFKDKNILISGGGDSAVDWANKLHSIAEKVTVVHRRDEFRAFEKNIQSMKEKTHVLTPYTIQHIQGEEGMIKQVTIENLETKETESIQIDALLVNHGFSEEFGGLDNWGLARQDGKIVVNDALETNIPGIFAAGDVVTYPHKLNLFVAGFTEGPVALNSASAYLNPDSGPKAMYSTHHEALHLKKHS